MPAESKKKKKPFVRDSKHQTRLRFAPELSSSDDVATASPSHKLTPAKVRYELPSKRITRTTKPAINESDSSHDILSSASPLPAMKSKSVGVKKNGGKPQNGLMDFFDLPDDMLPPRSSKPTFLPKRKTRKRPTFVTDESSGGSTPEAEAVVISSDSDDEDIPAVKKPSSNENIGLLSRAGVRRHISLSDTDEYEAPPRLPGPRKAIRGGGMFSSPHSTKKPTRGENNNNPRPRPKGNKARRGGILSSSSRSSSFSTRRPSIQEDGDDESEDLIISSPKRSQRPIFCPNPDSETEEEEIRPSTQRRHRPTRTVSPLKRQRQSSEDSGSDVIATPFKLRRTGNRVSQAASVSPEAPTETPSRVTRQSKTRRHRNEKEKARELLQRRRAGENIEQVTDTSESETDEDDAGAALEHLSDFEDEEEEEEIEVAKPKRKTGKSGIDDNASGNPDEDFIVDDEDEPLGVPAMNSIPLEFTHQAHKPLKEHFKDAIEWMIHNKINPAFPRDDPVYRQAFLKLEDECNGLAKSKFTSTQWTRDFTAALYARPQFITGPLAEGEGYGVDGRPKCDACNHRSHVPTSFIQLCGKAYDQRTLEEVDQGSDYEDSDSGSTSPRSVNQAGLYIPRETTKWFVGRFCHANAEQTHLLTHWKYALNEWVKDNLENQHELTPTKLAQRERMKARDRTRYANDIVDQWEANGMLKNLYRDFKNQTSAARELKQGARGAWVS